MVIMIMKVMKITLIRLLYVEGGYDDDYNNDINDNESD